MKATFGRRVQHGIGEILKALSGRVFDLGVRVVGECKKDSTQLDRLEGQGAAGGHSSDTQWRIFPGILFRLGGKLKSDSFRLARIQGLISPKAAPAMGGELPPGRLCVHRLSDETT